jgi:hypothetical protein
MKINKNANELFLKETLEDILLSLQGSAVLKERKNLSPYSQHENV